MLTNGIQVQKYVKASAGRAGISVVFEECAESAFPDSSASTSPMCVSEGEDSVAFCRLLMVTSTGCIRTVF